MNRQAATIRAALFKLELPPSLTNEWLRERLFEQKPTVIDAPVASTREFCIALFNSKIEATIRNIGNMIGWESDGNVVGPRAAAAKKSISRFIPHMMPEENSNEPAIYRLVLEHGDYGIHSMTIATDGSWPEITSLFDWETGSIVPALLSDTMLATLVDLVTDEDGKPCVTRVGKNSSPEHEAQQKAMTEHYHKASPRGLQRMILFSKAPDYQKAIRAGKDARHLWFALRDWRGDDAEAYFGDLGSWADGRMSEIGAAR